MCLFPISEGHDPNALLLTMGRCSSTASESSVHGPVSFIYQSKRNICIYVFILFLITFYAINVVIFRQLQQEWSFNVRMGKVFKCVVALCLLISRMHSSSKEVCFDAYILTLFNILLIFCEITDIYIRLQTEIFISINTGRLSNKFYSFQISTSRWYNFHKHEFMIN